MSDLNTSWQNILAEAIAKPGLIHEAYSRFHDYSVGNQLLAISQCAERGITAGPIGTFMHWKSCGRHVRKGEKALVLCMPVTCRKHERETDDAGNEVERDTAFTRFIYRPHWFVLAQTEGADYAAPPVPRWDRTKALAALQITETPFAAPDGNMQGYAEKRSIAISPVAAMPDKTTFHELAHVVLGHTSESSMTDTERTPRNVREIEAESVTLLCLESLGLPGAEYARGYIQSWGSEIPERSAQKIFHAADLILKAGEVKPAEVRHAA